MMNYQYISITHGSSMDIVQIYHFYILQKAKKKKAEATVSSASAANGDMGKTRFVLSVYSRYWCSSKTQFSPKQIQGIHSLRKSSIHTLPCRVGFKLTPTLVEVSE